MSHRIRVLLFLRPWLTAPLALLAVWLVAVTPVLWFTWIGWILYGAGIAAAATLALGLRTRYRLSLLDSSPLGVVAWLQRLR